VKTLYLLRHAKSSWSDPSLDDSDRPLSGRGRKAATVMGRYFRKNGLAPGVVLCSTAVRARETLERLDEGRGVSAPVRFQKSLYLASPSRMLAALCALDDRYSSAMLVGHEPDIRNLALELAGDGAPLAMRRLDAKFPTGALAVLTFPVDRWRALAAGNGRLESFVRPRDLAD
jgi:phosphohistidine phosphatase